ncbi:YciK family oxidoreductase [Chromatium okenii]|uniref:SDR family NAD(P)-dependent oxidoreductase n=1 Tax=Chromatium okenii TaxID=61644 RepID=UPI0019065D5C|nr:SDR family NAD(P)-dependent oxidoreductase [Chromatium okenii]MBK1640750.1 YciK family oxidoreductase [Chromatium okenii]
MTPPLHERVILVTGASEGIGHAVAIACAHAGATVILSSFHAVDLEPVYDAIVAHGNPEPAILPLNLETASEADFIAAANIIGDTFGRLDGLAHCAAFAPYLSRIDDYEATEWERVLRINLTAPFLLTQVCLPLLRAAPNAAVVFTTDRVGRNGKAYWGAYAAAKFGIEGLAQVLADESSASGHLRVSIVDPGIVRTALRAHLYPGEDPHTHPTPDTIAGEYVRCLSHPC